MTTVTTGGEGTLHDVRARTIEWIARVHEHLAGPPAAPSGTAATAPARDAAEELRAGLELAAEEMRAEDEALHEMAAALERTLARYRHLFDAAPVALLVTDLHGRVREANQHALRLLGGAGHAPLAGQLLVRFVAVRERRAFRQALLAAAHQVGRRTLMLRLRSSQGFEHEVEVTLKPRCHGPGTERCVHWALHDLGHGDAAGLL
ncbi:MAG TPA: PAS domain-containing protein [Gemmatimonadaceae bacterium]|nr:PAS domain-containing protein [Gemmatimonadaceae bacterium]